MATIPKVITDLRDITKITSKLIVANYGGCIPHPSTIKKAVKFTAR
jgi:hypothetical protein